MITVREVGDVILYLGAVATALVAIGALLRWAIVRPIKKWITEQISPVRQTAVAVEKNTQAVMETADKVHAEVTPNHGGSLKDVVTRTELKVDVLAQRFDDHLINHPKGAP